MLIHKSKKLETAWACLTEKILYNKINYLDTKHEQKDTNNFWILVALFVIIDTPVRNQTPKFVSCLLIYI